MEEREMAVSNLTEIVIEIRGGRGMAEGLSFGEVKELLQIWNERE